LEAVHQPADCAIAKSRPETRQKVRRAVLACQQMRDPPACEDGENEFCPESRFVHGSAKVD
jgi:hypothetical protein